MHVCNILNRLKDIEFLIYIENDSAETYTEKVQY